MTYRQTFVGHTWRRSSHSIRTKTQRQTETWKVMFLCCTDRCSSWLASALLYNTSSRSSGRPCAPDGRRTLSGRSWQECRLHSGGSSSGPENRRRTACWATGMDSRRPCTTREVEEKHEWGLRKHTLCYSDHRSKFVWTTWLKVILYSWIQTCCDWFIDLLKRCSFNLVAVL